MIAVTKKIGWFVLLGLILISSYEAFAVYTARRMTPEIFEKILADKSVAIRLDNIPAKRIEQLLAIEDPAFYQHNGVDMSTPGAGLTTITQALVKYLYFERFRPGFMKLEQTLIAWLAVNPLISKDDQLTAFFNTAYLGNINGRDIRGFPDASEAYFGKSFNDLTDDEYLSLVAMLIGPDAFNIKDHSEKNAERVTRIKHVLSGAYRPAGNRDVYYEHTVD